MFSGQMFSVILLIRFHFALDSDSPWPIALFSLSSWILYIEKFLWDHNPYQWWKTSRSGEVVSSKRRNLTGGLQLLPRWPELHIDQIYLLWWILEAIFLWQNFEKLKKKQQGSSLHGSWVIWERGWRKWRYITWW